jgi:nucleoside-diphosphate-sugar epimerase
MKIRWITPLLGTAAANAVRDVADINIIDVRDLVDKAGNRSEPIREKIRQGVESLGQGKRTVVCCDYGMSRSNAIAIGILTSFDKVTFDCALRQVQEATGETQIKLEPLNAVRVALGLHYPKRQNTESRSVLVTGGNGFLGSALIQSLGSEFRIVAPTRKELDICTGSTQLDLLTSEENIDCIIHLANPRVYTSNVAMGESLTMLRGVIDVCLAKDIPLVYPSGWEIYSGYAGILHVDESTPALPRGPYGETKYLVEMLIEHCRRTLGLRCAILRSSPVYGSGSDKPKFIYNFIEKAKRGQKITTHCYNNGSPSLDLLHIDDLVSALVATIKTNFVGTLNLGTGVLNSTLRISEMIRDCLGSSSLIEQIAIDSDVASISMNWNLASTELNWQPTISFEQGLEHLLSEITEHGDHKNEH